MSTEDYQEKTEPASPRKREETRKHGYVPLSLELNSAFSFLGFVSILSLLFFVFIAQLKGILQQSLTQISSTELNLENFHHLFFQGLIFFFKTAFPLLLIPLLLGILTNLLQTNFLFTFKPLFPLDEQSGTRANQVSVIGLKINRVFSRRRFFEGIKLSIKVLVGILLGYLLFRSELHNLVTLTDRGTEELLLYISTFFFKSGIAIAVIFLFFGLGDYLFQRWQYEKDLRMSREELKRELREEEGPPEKKEWLKDFMQSKSSSNG